MERYKKYEGFKNFLDGFEILEFNVESRNKNNYIYFLGYYREYKDKEDKDEILGFANTLKDGEGFLRQYKKKNGFSIKARGFYIERWVINVTSRWKGGFYMY